MIAAMRRLAPVALIASLVVAVPAWADETITARTPNEFASSVTTIDQGEKVTLRNVDIAGHDVTSTKREGGKPLFASDLVAPGDSGPVLRTEYLVTGSYPFVCTVHPGMEATLDVTAAGTPVPRPDPPNVEVKVASKDLQRVVRKRKLKLRVSSSKASVKVTARAKAGKSSIALGSKTVRFKSAGDRAVVLKLSKSAQEALAGRRRAKVTATATASDDAGQTAQSTATRKLR
jgi:plastocyanin